MKVVVECTKCREKREFGGATVADCFGDALVDRDFRWSHNQAKSAMDTMRALPKNDEAETVVAATWHLLARHVDCKGVAE